MLQSTIKFKLLTAPHLKIPRSPKEIVTPANGEKIIAEVDLRNTDCRLLQ
jgi:hypothetical protein